ncbi:hypothetical protein BDZ89DRAFT_7114 [Hymenopellis radicata]|nr:hypothetical protein BDZ89DRAFT_7114 [Hymenopellis radicata]
MEMQESMDKQEWDTHVPFSPDAHDSDGQNGLASTKRRARRQPVTQVPTPPDSMNNSPVCDDSSNSNDDGMFVSVSTTFYPGAQNHSLPPDVTLLTQDNVFFYVHSPVLLAASTNGFRSLIPVIPASVREHGPIIHVPESSPVLNIILHTIYDMSCTHYTPSFDTLDSAVKQFPAYGLDLKTYVTPQKPLFTHLLSQAPLYPIELYALASYFNLYELAVSTSSHLLSFQLSGLSDELVDRIGPRYLKRLFFLHIGRADALKRMLLPPPPPHPPTPWCGFEEQKKLTRAWALASAYLAWDARPDLSVATVESALSPLADHISCQLCQASLNERVKNLVVQWSVVKRTI